MRYRRAAPRLRPGFGAEASGARGGPPAAGTPGPAAAVLKCIRLGGLNQRREPKKNGPPAKAGAGCVLLQWV